MYDFTGSSCEGNVGLQRIVDISLDVFDGMKEDKYSCLFRDTSELGKQQSVSHYCFAINIGFNNIRRKKFEKAGAFYDFSLL